MDKSWDKTGDGAKNGEEQRDLSQLLKKEAGKARATREPVCGEGDQCKKRNKQA
jgi:hypothetical protein